MEASFWDGKRAPGVIDTVDVEEHQSVLLAINTALKSHRDRPAFTSLGYTMTFGELDRHSDNFASYLQRFTDLKPGDRIAIQLPNSLQYPIVVYGAIRAGLIIVNTNPLYTAHEMLHQFKDADVKALVYMEMFGDRVETILEKSDIHYFFNTCIADMLPPLKRFAINWAAKYIKKLVPDHCMPGSVPLLKALSLGDKIPYSPIPNPDKDDVVVLQYTGGTTGVAKGAMLTNGNLVANVSQGKATLSQTGKDGKPLYSPGEEILIAPLPLYHIYSFTVHLVMLVCSGDHSILIANPRDTDTFIRMIKPWKMTAFVGLNTLFISLMDHPKFKGCDFSRLKMTLSGGTAITADTIERWKSVTGCDIAEAYGLTECSPMVCSNPINGLGKEGTVGVAAPNTALKVIDADENELPLGERGELCVKGPQVMLGYWKRPEASKDTLTQDGWLRTGDIAIIEEDGYVSIVDRLKDLILVSGFNVYPNEIEDVVSLMSQVAECAVIGVDNKKSGEAPMLFVIKNSEVSREEILTHCRSRLTGYKLPRSIEFVDELPKSLVGKILRRELRDSFLSGEFSNFIESA